MGKSYQSRYSWNYFKRVHGVDVLAHTDNSVSIAFRWDGFHTALQANARVQEIFENLRGILHGLPHDQDVVIENHFSREYSDDVSQAYWDYGEKHIVRHHDFAKAVRSEMANLISSIAMKTRVLCVVTLEQRLTPLDTMFPKRALKKSTRSSEQLIRIVKEHMTRLPGAKLLDNIEFEEEIWRIYHRERALSGKIPKPNPRFKLCDRIATKPSFEHGCIKIGNTYSKVILLVDYPDAEPNWFYNIAQFSGIDFHVTQILKPMDVSRIVRASASQSERAQESAAAIGGESVREKMGDHDSYRSIIANRKLKAYNNAYIITLHHPDPEVIEDCARSIVDLLGESTVIAPYTEEVSFAMWRASQLAQGHRTPFLRDDHTLQAANMAPVITFDEGDKVNRHMLRVTSDAQAITLSYPAGGSNHTITAAKTKSGKGIETGAQMCELYPLGVNFYGAEIGSSYKWVVEAFDGDYFHLDSNTVISPFPDYSLADTTNEKAPIDADIVNPTIGSLLPLLARGAKDLEHHIEPIAQTMMSWMYLQPPQAGKKAPTLKTFFDMADTAVGHFSGVQRKAAQAIKENLDSFLIGSSGQNFENADSLDFSKGIVFVDFKNLMGNEALSKFLFVFITLRFKQLAFADSNPVRIILDELHEFVRIDPVLTMTLIKQITRMGRKEAGFFHGISQEVLDMDLELGILNQISHRNFMFLQDGHQETAKKFNMNDRVLRRWQSYKDPEAPGFDLQHRECMRMHAESSFDLHLKFPQPILDLAHSSPDALKIKNEIGKITKDPFERLRLFRERMEE